MQESKNISDLVLIKTCSRCKEIKSKTEFSKNGKGLRSYCKECNKKICKEWHEANPEKSKASNKRWIANNLDRRNNSLRKWSKANPDKKKKHAKNLYIRRSAFIANHKADPCMDCGCKYPHYVMQFDHVRGEKLFCIGEGRNRSQEKILEEIAKCDLVCANCHAERTYQRLQSV